MRLEVDERLGVQFGGSEHSRTSRARVQRRISRRAAEMPTLFANQSRAFGFRIVSRLSRPVLFPVLFFASGTFDQHLAASTAESCKLSSCLGIFEIFILELPAPHAIPAVLALVRVHVTRHVAVLLACCAYEHSSRKTCVVSHRHLRPCPRREFLHACRTPVDVCVALLVRKLLCADSTHSTHARTCQHYCVAMR